MNSRKILVIDTSVLLYSMTSIHSFPGNELIIPLVVLDELDRFKDKPGLLGESARYVNRYLDNLRDKGNLNKGITLEDTDQVIRVELRAPRLKELDGLEYDKADNKIISTAFSIKKENPSRLVKVITKDINLRVKCDALDLDAEDYYNDHVEIDGDLTSYKNLDISDEDIDSLYDETFKLGLENIVFENQFIIAKSANKSFIGIYKDNKIR